MQMTFLGTGTSQGVPMVACPCPVCRSDDLRNHRTRTSIHVVMDGLHIQVDAAQEFRLQCLKNQVEQVDLFILTHGHADHVLGMDDLRRFCDQRDGVALPVYCTEEGMARVKSIFPYAILERAVQKGYPAFALALMPPVLELPQGTIQSVRLPHGSIEVLGLVFTERSTGRKLVYYTDCKKVGLTGLELARGADIVVLDALRQQPHPSHMNLEEATVTALEIQAPRTYFTHLTHTIDHAVVEEELPEGIFLAYDGLRLEI